MPPLTVDYIKSTGHAHGARFVRFRTSHLPLTWPHTTPSTSPCARLTSLHTARHTTSSRVSKADDSHQFHINRLELELLQRKALCETRDGALAERVAAAERNVEKQVRFCLSHSVQLVTPNS